MRQVICTLRRLTAPVKNYVAAREGNYANLTGNDAINKDYSCLGARRQPKTTRERRWLVLYFGTFD